MRLRSLLVVVAVAIGWAWAPSADAQILAGAQCPALFGPGLSALANETLTVSNSAKALTLTKYTTTSGQVAVVAILSVQAQAINAIDDGSTATSSIGMLLQPSSATLTGFYYVCGKSIARLSMIRNGGSDATVNVIYLFPQ